MIVGCPHVPQLEVLASLESKLCPGLALGALQSQDNLLGGLGLLVEDGLGLTTVTGLLAVISALSLGEQRSLREGYPISSRRTEIGAERHLRTLPALYCVTLCWVCFRQSRPLQ